MADQPVTINPAPDPAFLGLETKKVELQAGWLGRLFGTGANAPMNVAGFTVIILVVAGFVFSVVESKIVATEYWKMITPIITLVFGYAFGKKD